MDYLAITKEQYIKTLAAYHKESIQNSKQYYYIQACALSSLLEKFGLDHMDLEVLENEAKATI